MTTRAQLRKAALGLPEVEEETHPGMVAFSVRGKGFASVTEDGVVQLQLPDGDHRVPLGDVNGQELNSLVHRAWRSRAPKRLVERSDAADAGRPPADSDLPAAIGKPATRALLGVGITDLAAVADHSEAELLAMHGVGPKAVRVLGEALAERGSSFRSG